MYKNSFFGVSNPCLDTAGLRMHQNPFNSGKKNLGNRETAEHNKAVEKTSAISSSVLSAIRTCVCASVCACVCVGVCVSALCVQVCAQVHVCESVHA